MGREKDTNKKMAKGFIIGGLVLYILLGAAAAGVYYYDTSGIKERIAAAERVRDAANRLPDISSTTEETIVTEEEYDTEEGTAGAARDLPE